MAGGHARVVYLNPFARLFYCHLDESISLARLMGAADPERVAHEAFARLQPRMDGFATPADALTYLRAVVCLQSRGDNRRQNAGRRRLWWRRPATPDVSPRVRRSAPIGTPAG